MDTNQGTPKTIEEAILNGLREHLQFTKDSEDQLIRAIKTHVRDFMAQKAFHKDQNVAANYRSFYFKVFNLTEEK